ncbi:hypothetical protein [Microbacterium sp. P02]|uniref:hypothetical protein n=1 Tax=Microbacterium sp. P02 TaxID=3366260 RepID=UPI00366EC379
MSWLLGQLAAGLRVTGAASVAYLGSVILLATALVPATLRTVQLFTRNDNGWLEVVVELLRIVLVVAMIALGRNWSATDVFAGSQWAAVGRDISHAWRSGWAGILLQLTVVTALALILNAAFEYAVTVDRTTTLLAALNVDPAYAHRTTDAVTFAVKNLIVIPVYLMAMMQALHITGTR